MSEATGCQLPSYGLTGRMSHLGQEQGFLPSCNAFGWSHLIRVNFIRLLNWTQLPGSSSHPHPIYSKASHKLTLTLTA